MGDTDDERACFPIRLGSYINGGSVTIINDINSEASNTLQKYDCGIVEKKLNKLADRTIEFLNDPKLQQEKRKNVKRARRELSWDNLIKNLIQYYNEIL